MASADVQVPPVETPGLPDYLLDPNATLKDDSARWRYGKAPDYSNTRKVYQATKTKSHEAASLPNLVENLVKNWEVEASFKPEIDDWRTIDRLNYTFSINGGPPQSAEYMLQVGTYNAIITSNDYYDPANSDFASSHKTFKRMMPTFAWEVLEVYSGPPTVAFKWRHWGVMKNDYVGFNDKGEKVTAKAHGGPIDIQGITIAKVDDKVRLQAVETWFDPLEMFRQISPSGAVTRTIHVPKPGEVITTQPHGEGGDQEGENVAKELEGTHLSSKQEFEGGLITGSGSPRTGVFPPGTTGRAPELRAGLAVPSASGAHAEMASATPASCPFLAPSAPSA